MNVNDTNQMLLSKFEKLHLSITHPKFNTIYNLFTEFHDLYIDYVNNDRNQDKEQLYNINDQIKMLLDDIITS